MSQRTSKHDKHDRHDRHDRHDSRATHGKRSRSDRDRHDKAPKINDRERHRDREPGGSSHKRIETHCDLPPRPPTNGRSRSDAELEAKCTDYPHFRRMKRMKLATEHQWLIWGPSPSPSPEPEVPKVKGSKSTKTKKPKNDSTHSAEVGPLDLEIADAEAALFMGWLERKRASAAAAAEKQRQVAKANAMVGPSLPEGLARDKMDDVSIVYPLEAERMAGMEPAGHRIPQRGEVGMKPDQISHFESVGYVMSGSRHKKMEPVRVRKENQVYTAEEKAALAMFNAEEARKKEANLMSELKSLVEQVTGQEAGDDA